jgi:hypothetical protein
MIIHSNSIVKPALTAEHSAIFTGLALPNEPSVKKIPAPFNNHKEKG